MPIGTPFHPRTSELCTSFRWKDWSGYYGVCSYDICHEREYYAFRHAAGLLDVSPLYKYEVYGPDAAAFLSYITVKNIAKLKLGQVTYCCWCDDDGKVIDDGTITRFEENYFRLTAALPTFYLLERHRPGFRVTVEDTSDQIAALALQGPNAREILKQITSADLDALGFFRATEAPMDGFTAQITRTGYTGDLGYEVWVPKPHALRLWDILIHAGRPYGIQPAGLDALDVTRIEAGFILNGIEYFSAPTCLIDARKSSPFEIGLGWTVNLERDPFIGQAALKQEKTNGSVWQTVGLVMDWDELEALYARYGLPPEVCSSAWRTGVPIYADTGEHVGQATSGTWSPILKKNLAIATIKSAHANEGRVLKQEVTVEYERHQVSAVVTKTPFFNPERKRSTLTEKQTKAAA